MFKLVATLTLTLVFLNPDLSAQVFLKSDGNVAIGADTTDHPLEIHSPETDSDTFDIVVGILSESSKRPAIQFAELDPIRPTSGMSIEYDGRMNGSNNKLHIRGVDGSVQYTFKSTASFGVGTDNPDGGIHVVHDSPNAFTDPNIRVTESEYDFARLQFDNTEMPGALWDIAGLADTIESEALLNFFYGRETPLLGRNVMSLTGTGFVGIGTESPQTPLEVVHVDKPALTLTKINGGVTDLYIKSDDPAGAYWRESYLINSSDPTRCEYNLYFHSNDSTLQNVLHVDDLGQVGIGTSGPGNKLDIRSDGTFNQPEIVLGLISNTSNRPVIQFSESTTATATSGMSIQYSGAPLFTPRLSFRSTSAVDVFRFDNNGGAFKPGGGSWSALSDRRLKTNICDYEHGLSLVSQIHPVRFNYNKDTGYPTEEVHVGVIAQELAEVAPSMVTEVATDSGEKYLSVDNSEMVYALINAVKELSEENHKQQELIEELVKTQKKMYEEIAALRSESEMGLR